MSVLYRFGIPGQFKGSTLFMKREQYDDFVIWGGVLFATQVWVLLKWKSTQLDIFILW